MNVLLIVLTSTVLQILQVCFAVPSTNCRPQQRSISIPVCIILTAPVAMDGLLSFSDMFGVLVEGCCAFSLCLIVFIQMCRTVSKQQCLRIPRQLCDPSSSRLVCSCFLNTEKLWNVQLTRSAHFYHDHFIFCFRNSNLALPQVLKESR